MAAISKTMTMLNDPIGDLLTRMRNAQHARKSSCSAPWSKIKVQLCEILKREGYLENVEVTGDAPKQDIVVTFVPGKMIDVQRVSKPGRRRYESTSALKPVLNGYGMAIITTSKGLLTDKEARSQKVGGEVLCTVS